LAHNLQGFSVVRGFECGTVEINRLITVDGADVSGKITGFFLELRASKLLIRFICRWRCRTDYASWSTIAV